MHGVACYNVAMEEEPARPRFRVRTLMIAVAIFSLVFAVWAFLADLQRSLDRFYGPGGTLRRERAASLVPYARLHLLSGEHAKAEAEFVEALKMIGGPGENDLLAAQARAGLGLALVGQGRFAEAEPHLKSVLAIRERSSEWGEPDSKEIIRAYAEVLRATGRVAEAEAQEARIPTIRDGRAGASSGKSP